MNMAVGRISMVTLHLGGYRRLKMEWTDLNGDLKFKQGLNIPSLDARFCHPDSS